MQRRRLSAPWFTRPILALPLAAAAQGAGGAAGAEGERDREIDQAELERVTAEVRAQVEDLRGHAFERPVRVAVTDREGLLSYARKRLDSTTSPAELQAQETAAKLLGLVPVEMDLLATTLELLEEQVGGFYDPDEEAFYLMSAFGGDLARIILAHELTHALDDQLFDLDGRYEALAQQSDASFAYHAVVEGSGTALMAAWMGRWGADLDPAALLEDGASLGLESLAEAPPFLWKPLLAAYVKGAAFLARTESLIESQLAPYVAADVDAAFAAPPRSSEQVLHPEKYWDEGARDEPREVAIDASRLPDGWSVLDQDTLGELGLARCAEPLAKRKAPKGQLGLAFVRYTSSAAEGWGGDSFVLLGRGEARVLHGVTVWDSAADATEFREALEALLPHVAQASAALAARAGVQGAGYALGEGAAPDEVRFTSWVGRAREELDLLLARLEVRVAPAASAAGSPEAGSDALGRGR